MSQSKLALMKCKCKLIIDQNTHGFSDLWSFVDSIRLSKIPSVGDGLRERGDAFNAVVLLGYKVKLFDSIRLEVPFNVAG